MNVPNTKKMSTKTNYRTLQYWIRFYNNTKTTFENSLQKFGFFNGSVLKSNNLNKRKMTLFILKRVK